MGKVQSSLCDHSVACSKSHYFLFRDRRGGVWKLKLRVIFLSQGHYSSRLTRSLSRTRFARVLVDFQKVKESNVCVQANHAGVLFCEVESKSSVEKLSWSHFGCEETKRRMTFRLRTYKHAVWHKTLVSVLNGQLSRTGRLSKAVMWLALKTLDWFDLFANEPRTIM